MAERLLVLDKDAPLGRGRVLAGGDAQNARQLFRAGRVEGADSGVGVRAPQDLPVRHARQPKVRHVIRRPRCLDGAVDGRNALSYISFFTHEKILRSGDEMKPDSFYYIGVGGEEFLRDIWIFLGGHFENCPPRPPSKTFVLRNRGAPLALPDFARKLTAKPPVPPTHSRDLVGRASSPAAGKMPAPPAEIAERTPTGNSYYNALQLLFHTSCPNTGYPLRSLIRWMSAELQPNAYSLRCSTIRWWRIRQKIQGEKPSYITPTRMGYPSFGVSGSAGTSASPAGCDRRYGGGGCVRYPGPGPGDRSVSAPDPPAARGPRPFRPCGGTHFHTRGGRNTRSGSGARRPYSRSRAHTPMGKLTDEPGVISYGSFSMTHLPLPLKKKWISGSLSCT